jgi:Asp-tRNA(Asn)/Glu-tRNA(Gln) amidotransferase A subunit family amidase
MAKKRDQERGEAKKKGTLDKLPIMHGVPISIKDLYEQKGKLATGGCQFLCQESDRFTEDAVAV